MTCVPLCPHLTRPSRIDLLLVIKPHFRLTHQWFSLCHPGPLSPTQLATVRLSSGHLSLSDLIAFIRLLVSLQKYNPTEQRLCCRGLLSCPRCPEQCRCTAVTMHSHRTAPEVRKPWLGAVSSLVGCTLAPDPGHQPECIATLVPNLFLF